MQGNYEVSALTRNPNHIRLVRHLMEQLNFGCRHLCFQGSPAPTISGRRHCTPMWPALGTASLSFLAQIDSGLNHRKGKYCSWKRLQHPSPCGTDKESRGDLLNFLNCLFILTCVWISCVQRRDCIHKRQPTKNNHLYNLYIFIQTQGQHSYKTLCFKCNTLVKCSNMYRSLFLN